MARETYDWSVDYADEAAGTTTTFTSATSETVDVSVSQPDPNGWYRAGRDGFESTTTMGGDSTGFFEMGVNFPNGAATLTTTIDFSNNTQSGQNSVTDVSFTLYDIDSTSTATFQDEVTVLAFDALGNPLTVTLTAVDPSVVLISGATATAIPGAGSGPSGSVAATSTQGNVIVSIAGEVASIQIIYGNGSSVQPDPGNQAIGISDLSFDLTPPIICFARGTKIRAMPGDVPVEELRVGDMVMTADNGLQPIRWIASRSVPARGNLAPVLFMKGAIGNARPLVLSPQHRVMLSGWKAELFTGHSEVLVTAKHLVNGINIVQTEQNEVEYFHFIFDEHQIVFAEGAPCESLFVGAESLSAITCEARAELMTLFPDLVSRAEAYGPTARHCLRRHEALVLNSQVESAEDLAHCA